MGIQVVDISPLPTERFESVLGDRYADFAAAVEQAKKVFDHRTVWNVNSTGKGGGVAEMLRSLIAYAEGAGVSTEWLVIEGNPDFFKVTKRIHNNLHGAEGDGGPLGDAEQEIYRSTLAGNAGELTEMVGAEDVVILHDPQTAGLTAALKEKGATVLWRCHVGLDTPNDVARRAWAFLRPHVEPADAYIFSRQAFVWDELDDAKIAIIPPSIDAFSPKNQDIDAETVQAILEASGVGTDANDAAPEYLRVDGSKSEVVNQADMIGGPLPHDAKAVVQVSRWDRLKDPLGVMQGFVDHVVPNTDAHLVLAGPSVESVADDPEGADVLKEAKDLWESLDESARARIHLAALPMDDGEENAAIVNALQRRADIVVQKSLAEGFGLTVAEGMWKGRPVVASKIGGIQDQIVDGESGVLLQDPEDQREYGEALVKLLNDESLAAELGTNARERVRSEFLGARHLTQYLELIARLLG